MALQRSGVRASLPPPVLGSFLDVFLRFGFDEVILIDQKMHLFMGAYSAKETGQTVEIASLYSNI